MPRAPVPEPGVALSQARRPEVDVALAEVVSASQLRISPGAVAHIRRRLNEAASEVLTPTAVVEAAVERIALREGRGDRPGPISHPSHAAWLRELAAHRLEAEAANLGEALSRACSHLRQLPLPRLPADPEISEIEVLGSESHNGGKRPVRIRFARDQAVVYKPVSLQADHLVCSLLQELTRAAGRKRLFSNPAYAPVGESYGFVAFASTAQRTHSRKSLRRFYFRFGALVAAAYALNITDLHMENVLAVGEHPTLIDFETAFYRFPDALHPTDITSTGLVEKPGRSAPSSGLQGGGSCLEWALDPRAERGLAVVGYRRARFHTANRRSDAVGRLVEPSAFRQELMDGFDFGYRLVLGERDRLRRHIQLRLETEEVRIRHILRFTSHYVVRYFQMLQPAAAPMAERRRGLRLGLAEHRSALDAPAESVLDAEVDDLLRGDVPYFWSHLDSRDLRHHGGLVQPSCFSSSPFELLEEQFRRLSEADLRDQRLILAEALA